MTGGAQEQTGDRTDAVDKVLAGAMFVSDVAVPGMLHGKVLRSPHPHARLVKVDASRARAMPGVSAVATHADLVGMERTTGWRIRDWPILAFDRVRYAGDVVAAVAAVDEATAYAALETIEVEYEVLPFAASIADALAPDAPEIFDPARATGAPRYGPGARGVSAPERNVCYRYVFEKGNVAEAFARCDHVFEDTFTFSRAQHFHLEPHVSVAEWRSNRLIVWSGAQSPFLLRDELATIFHIDQAQVRIHVPYVGGAFGAKNPCRMEALAALLARLAGRPVRICLTFDESFLTVAQHGAILTVKTGVRRDGTLVARESRIQLDCGAYSDAGPHVCEKAGFRMPGVYRWEALSTVCDAVMTNTVPGGPYRGFGGPQASWAVESQLDMIARRIGIDPYAMRVKNMLALREPYVPGESGIDSDLQAGLDLVCSRLDYDGRERGTGRGMGLAVGMKDGGGQNKPAQARLKATPDGQIFLHCGSIELGQGATSALCEIVARVLRMPRRSVVYAEIDTDVTPYDNGTRSSSSGTVMGTAVERAARTLRDTVLSFAAQTLGWDKDALDLDAWHVTRGSERVAIRDLINRTFGRTGFDFEAKGEFSMPQDFQAPHNAQSMFWECGWAGAEVAVDRETGEVQILRLIVSGDCGVALNPAAAHGQEESNALASLGQALFEHLIYRDGVLVTSGPLTYRVLAATDVPAGFEMIPQEQGYGPGPFGAKGAGEGSLLVVAAAIANAIDDAVGARVTALPLSPERVLAAIASSAGLQPSS